METIIEALRRANTWWEKSDVRAPLLKRMLRDEFTQIVKHLKTRPILSLIGPRRVGKSTLLFQTINYLLDSGADPRRVLFFSADIPALFSPGNSITDIIEAYIGEVLYQLPEEKDERVYIFIDEIHFMKDWQLHLKAYYDQQYNVKFIISGSSAVHLFKNSKESLLGRIEDIYILPLNLHQFLRFYNVYKAEGELTRYVDALPLGSCFDNPEAYYDALSVSPVKLMTPDAVLIRAVKEFLLAGGYPEYFESQDILLWQHGLVDHIVARGLYRDIALIYGVKNPEAMENLLYVIAANSGGEFSYSSIGQTLGIDKGTAQSYLRYLGEAFLINELSNYSSKAATVVRKNRKIYIADNGIRNAYLSDLELTPELEGFLAENAGMQFVRRYSEANYYRRYYRREKMHEVDMVIKKRGTNQPVEIKYRNDIGASDFSGLQAFMEQYPCPWGVMITKRLLEKRGNIFCMPLWMLH
jgi:predicted AAA+ superfamily ATPase